MVRVNNCCGCCDLKSGTIAVSIVYLVLAIVNMALGIAGVVGTKGVATYVGVSIDAIMLVLCILLIIGACMDNPDLCMVWVVGAIVWSVLTTIIAVVISAVFAANIAEHRGLDPDLPMPTGAPATAGVAAGLILGLGVVWAFVALKVCLVIYSAIVVYSHAQNLREGGGSPPPYNQFGGPKI
ncbi:hypothetical protein Bbelb_059220 [Branchiostoma belcheri]|nr:hypothetical protein Bbelb_059220 [Branchiostoma belcheri]